ncbi:MAG: epoxyqueuosine reductase [Candidatus Izemoplasmataceae bacterium]
MIESILKKHVDDFKTVSVKDYIDARRRHFPHSDEDFSFLDGYDTIVVMSLSFPRGRPPYKGKGYGMISRYAHGKDYHLVYKEKIEAITKALEEEGFKAQGRSDINPIDERFAGYLSGLGFIGHNQFLIHPHYGTHHYLATILIDRPFTVAPYLKDTCGSCTKCIDACPTDALSTQGFIESRCLSHKTQAKAAYDLKTLSDFKTFVFGCDICQDVCPKNKGITPVEREVFKSDEAAQLHLKSVLEMSNKAFMRAYGDYAFAWRGGLVIKRNAIALLFNQGLYDSLPLIRNAYATYKHVPWFEKTVRPILEKMEETDESHRTL